MRALLAAVLLMANALAATIGTEVGYVDVSGVNFSEGTYVLVQRDISIRAISTRDFRPLNYTLDIRPRNLERLARDLGVPLSGELGWDVPAGMEESLQVELPEIVCGNYRLSVDAYYSLNGTVRHYSEQFPVRLPCGSAKATILSKLVSMVPYPLLKGVAGLLGFRF